MDTGVCSECPEKFLYSQRFEVLGCAFCSPACCAAYRRSVNPPKQEAAIFRPVRGGFGGGVA